MDGLVTVKREVTEVLDSIFGDDKKPSVGSSGMWSLVESSETDLTRIRVLIILRFSLGIFNFILLDLESWPATPCHGT